MACKMVCLLSSHFFSFGQLFLNSRVGGKCQSFHYDKGSCSTFKTSVYGLCQMKWATVHESFKVPKDSMLFVLNYPIACGFHVFCCNPEI